MSSDQEKVRASRRIVVVGCIVLAAMGGTAWVRSHQAAADREREQRQEQQLIEFLHEDNCRRYEVDC